jgi:hypothetical protein
MKLEIKPDTPLSVLLHVYPEAETVLSEYFADVKFSSVTDRVKTLEDISREENVDAEKLVKELKSKLDQS